MKRNEQLSNSNFLTPQKESNMTKEVPIYEGLSVLCELFSRQDSELRTMYELPSVISANKMPSIVPGQSYAETVLLGVLKNYTIMSEEQYQKYYVEKKLEELSLEELINLVTIRKGVLTTEEEKMSNISNVIEFRERIKDTSPSINTRIFNEDTKALERLSQK